MNYPAEPIGRPLFFVVSTAMLVGVVQVGLVGRDFFISLAPGAPGAPETGLHSLNAALPVLTAVLLLLLLLATLVVMLRASRLERSGTKAWQTPGLDRQRFKHSPEGLMLCSADGRVQARTAGDNQVLFSKPAPNDCGQARYELATHLRRAVLQIIAHPEQKPELELHFQPLVDQYTNSVVSFEALLRWNHPDRGLVSPVAFIPVAEETGLIVDIGLWIVAQAHEQIREWDRQGFVDTNLSINISTRQLRDVADVTKLVASLRAKETERLTLEITESLLIADQDLYRDFLRQVRGLGAKLALDDFGTGYSSLSYLRNYRFDVLKIDRVFVSGLGMDDGVLDEEAKQADRNLVASIISLGKILDLEVVAEGVEHREELDALAELGCGLIQGFYYAKPMNAADALCYLRNASAVGAMPVVEPISSV